MAKTKTSIIDTEEKRTSLVEWIRVQTLPLTVSVTPGRKRSLDQNKLQRKWCLELEAQGDMSAEEYRGYAKLHFGIPILREENEEFRLIYDRSLKRFPYEHKLILMMWPYDLAVTRNMTTKQFTKYLDKFYEEFTANGFTLTIPKGGGEIVGFQKSIAEDDGGGNDHQE